MSRNKLILCTLLALAGAVLTLWHPLSSTLTKTAFLASLLTFLTGLYELGGKRRWMLRAMLTFLSVSAVFLFLPTAAPDKELIQKEYVRRMLRLKDTPYFWGGENSRGIDCSGLPRRAFRDALLTCGLRQGQGILLRNYLEQWWFDASARALGEGYRHYTVPLGITGTIQTLDTSGLRQGDLAVTGDGLHILAYVGKDQWIQADPGIGFVSVLNGKTDSNGWFLTPVSLHRWRLLQ